MDVSNNSQLSEIQQRCFALYWALSKGSGEKEYVSTNLEPQQQDDSGDDDNSNHSFASSLQQSSSSNYDLSEKFAEIQRLTASFATTWDKIAQETLAKSVLSFVKQVEITELVKVFFGDAKTISIKIYRVSDSNTAQAAAINAITTMFSRLKSCDVSVKVEIPEEQEGEEEQIDDGSQSQDSPTKKRTVASSWKRPQLADDVASLNRLFFDTVRQTKKQATSVLKALLNLAATLADLVPPGEFTSGTASYEKQYAKYFITGILRPKSHEEKVEWLLVASCLQALMTFLRRFSDQLVEFVRSSCGKEFLTILVTFLEKTKRTELYTTTATTRTTIPRSRGKTKIKRPKYHQIKSVSAFVIPLLDLLAEFGVRLFGHHLLVEPALTTVLDCSCKMIWAKSKEVNVAATRAIESLCINAGSQLSMAELVMSDQDRKNALNKHLSCLMSILSDVRSRSHHNSLALGCYGQLAPAWLTSNDGSDFSMSMDGTQQRVQHASLVGDLISKMTRISLTSAEEEEKGGEEGGNNEAEDALRRLTTLVKLVRNLPKLLDALMFSNFSKLFLREVCLMFEESSAISPEQRCEFAKLVRGTLETLDDRRMQDEADRLLTSLIIHGHIPSAVFAEPNLQPFSQRTVAILMRQVHILLERANFSMTKGVNNDEEKRFVEDLSSLVSVWEVVVGRGTVVKCPYSMLLLVNSMFLLHPVSCELRTSLYRLLTILFKHLDLDSNASLLEDQLVKDLLQRLENWQMIPTKQELLAICKCFFAIPYCQICRRESARAVATIIAQLCDIADDQLVIGGEGHLGKTVHSATLALVRQGLEWIQNSGDSLIPQFSDEIARNFLRQVVSRYSAWLSNDDEARLVQLVARFPESAFQLEEDEEESGPKRMLAFFNQFDLKLSGDYGLKWADFFPTMKGTRRFISPKISRIALFQIDTFLNENRGTSFDAELLFVDFFNDLVSHSCGDAGSRQLAGQVLKLLIQSASKNGEEDADLSKRLLEPCLRISIKTCSLSSSPLIDYSVPAIIEILHKMFAQDEDSELKTKSLWLLSQFSNSSSIRLVFDALFACDEKSPIHGYIRHLATVRLASIALLSESDDSQQEQLFSLLISEIASNDTNRSPLFRSTCHEIFKVFRRESSPIRQTLFPVISSSSLFRLNECSSIDWLFSVVKLGEPDFLPASWKDDCLACICRLVSCLENTGNIGESALKLCNLLVDLRQLCTNNDHALLEETALKLSESMSNFITNHTEEQPANCYNLALSLCHLAIAFPSVKPLLSRQIAKDLSSVDLSADSFDMRLFFAYTVTINANVQSSAESFGSEMFERDEKSQPSFSNLDMLGQISLATCQGENFAKLIDFLLLPKNKANISLKSQILLFNRPKDLTDLLLNRFQNTSLSQNLVLQFLVRLFDSIEMNEKTNLLPCFVDLFAEICGQIPVGKGPDNELFLTMLSTAAKAGFSISPSGVDISSLSKLTLWISLFMKQFCGSPLRETTALTFLSSLPLFGPQLSSLDTGPLRITLGIFIDKNGLHLNNESAGNPSQCAIPRAFTTALVENHSSWFLRDVLALIVFNSQWVCEPFLDKAVTLINKVDCDKVRLICIREVLNGLAISKEPTSSPKLWQNTFDQAFYFVSTLIENETLLPALFNYLEESGQEINRAIYELVSSNTFGCELVNRGLVSMAVLNALFDAPESISSKVPDKCHKGIATPCFDFRRFNPPTSYMGDLYDLHVYLQQRVFALLSSILRAKRPGAIEQILLLETPENYWKMLIGGGGTVTFFPQNFGLEKDDDDEEQVDDAITRHPVFQPFLRAIQVVLVPDPDCADCPNWLSQILNRIKTQQTGEICSTNVSYFLLRLLVTSMSRLASVNLARFTFEKMAKIVIHSQLVISSQIPLNYFVVDIFNATMNFTNFSTLPSKDVNLHFDQMITAMTSKVCTTIQLLSSSETSANINQAQVKKVCFQVVEQIVEAVKKNPAKIAQSRPNVPSGLFGLLNESNYPSCYLALRIVLALIENGYTVPTSQETVVWPLLNPPTSLILQKSNNPVSLIFGRGTWPYVLPYSFFAKTLILNQSSQILPGQIRNTLTASLQTWLSVKPETTLFDILLFLSDFCDDFSEVKFVEIRELLSQNFLTTSLTRANFSSTQAQASALEFAAAVGGLPNEIVPRVVEMFKKLAPPSKKGDPSLLPVWGHLICACLSSLKPRPDSVFLSPENLEALISSDYALKPALGSSCLEIRLIAYRLLHRLILQQQEQKGGVNEQLSIMALKALADPSDIVFDESLAFWCGIADKQSVLFCSQSPLAGRLVAFFEVIVCQHRLSHYPSLVLPVVACACLGAIFPQDEGKKQLLSNVEIMQRLTVLHYAQTTISTVSAVAMKRWQNPPAVKPQPKTSSIDEALFSVLRRDEAAAGRFLCSLIKSETSNETLKSSLSHCFDSCLRQVKDRRRSELLISTLFSIIYSCQISIVDRNVITNAGISSGHQDGAIALLESAFCPSVATLEASEFATQGHHHETKRRRLEENVTDSLLKSKLGNLIRLYRVAGDFDSAYGLAKLVAPSSTDLIEGLEAEANNNWIVAASRYESAVTLADRSMLMPTSGTSNWSDDELMNGEYGWQSELVLSGQMACLARLGDWNKLKSLATGISQRNQATNVTTTTNQSFFTGPSFSGSGSAGSSSVDRSSIRISSSSLSSEVLSYLGLAQSVLLISGEEEGALATNVLNNIYQQLTSGSSLHPKYGIPLGVWYALSGARQRASTLLTNATHSLLPAGLIFNDRDAFDRLKLIANIQRISQNFSALSKSSDLMLWNVMVPMRESFLLDTPSDPAELFALKLQRISALTHQGLFDVALTNLESLYKRNATLIRNDQNRGLDFTLTYAETHLAPLRIERLLAENAPKLAVVLPKIASELFKKKQFVDISGGESVEKALHFYRLLARTFECAERLNSQTTLDAIAAVFVDTPRLDPVTICSKLLEKAGELGQQDLDSASQLLRFAVRHAFDAQSFSHVVRLYLSSLSSNCQSLSLANTCLYLPMLLHPLEKFANDSSEKAAKAMLFDEFGRGLDRLVGACASPVLAPWLPYLVHSSRGKSRLVDAAQPAVRRYCVKHPHRAAYALSFDFNNNSENGSLLPELWATVRDLAPSTCSFIEALSCFRSPGDILRQLVSQAKQISDINLFSEIVAKTLTLFRSTNCWPAFFRDSAQKAASGLDSLLHDCPNTEFAAKFQSPDFNTLISSCDALPPVGNLSLSRVSPWFSGEHQDLNLPWLDDRSDCGIVNKIDPVAIVLPSLRRPVRMSVRLENGKSASLLIKSGEDLRQDEHVQLVQLTMAALFSANGASCCQLLVRSSYAVCPLLPCLGVLQWVDGAQPLADLAMSSLNDSQRSDLRRKAETILADFYNTNVDESHASGSLSLVQYTQLAARAMTSKSLRGRLGKMQLARENMLPANSLRKALLDHLPDASTAHRCRIQLLDSYAATSTCHFLLGIGDRHLKNVLVVPPQNDGFWASSVFVGVDFAYAFGMATSQLAVPELVPFRLTRQLSTLFWPCERGRFVRQMASCIKSLLTTSSDMALNASMAMFVERTVGGSNVEGVTLLDGVSQRLRLSPVNIFSQLLAKNKTLSRLTVANFQKNGDGIWRRFLETAFQDSDFDEKHKNDDENNDDEDQPSALAVCSCSGLVGDIKMEPFATLPLSTVLSSASSLMTESLVKLEPNLEQQDGRQETPLAPIELAEALVRLSNNRALLALAYGGWQSYV